MIFAKQSPAVLEYLLGRRSVKVETLAAPAPSASQIETILTAAARVPDHGKMVPWYFIVFEGAARDAAGESFAKHYLRANPHALPDQITRERERFLRAPLVIALIARIRPGKNPAWEQIMSAGAAAQNLSLAVHASGFGICWMTEWMAYDARVKADLGLDARDHIAGFFYIGTVTTPPEERDRPALCEIVTHWQPNMLLNKGDIYDNEKAGLPEAGFDLPPREEISPR